jgi:hypothetical protein
MSDEINVSENDGSSEYSSSFYNKSGSMSSKKFKRRK